MFSCDFWEISKNTFFTEHLWVTASKKWNISTKMVKENADLLSDFLLSPFYKCVQGGSFFSYLRKAKVYYYYYYYYYYIYYYFLLLLFFMFSVVTA